MPQKPDALTTLETVKSELNVKGSKNDERLSRLIDAASRWIESQTCRKLKARNYNGDDGTHETTDVPDEPCLFFSGRPLDQGGDAIRDGEWTFQVPQWPVQRGELTLEVLASREAGQDSENDTWTALEEGTDFLVDYDRGIVRSLGCFDFGYRNYRLTCTAGYLIGDNHPFVPEDLEQLCIELVRQIFKDRRNLQSESLGTWSRTFNTQASDPIVQDTLDKYRRLSL